MLLFHGSQSSNLLEVLVCAGEVFASLFVIKNILDSCVIYIYILDFKFSAPWSCYIQDPGI